MNIGLELFCSEHLEALEKGKAIRGACPLCLRDKARREGAIEMRKLIQKKMRDYATNFSPEVRRDFEFLADVISDAEDWPK